MTQTETNEKVQQLVELSERLKWIDDHYNDDNDEDYDFELYYLYERIPTLVLEIKEELLTMFE